MTAAPPDAKRVQDQEQADRAGASAADVGRDWRRMEVARERRDHPDPEEHEHHHDEEVGGDREQASDSRDAAQVPHAMSQMNATESDDAVRVQPRGGTR